MRKKRFYKDKLVIAMIVLAVISAGVIMGLTVMQTGGKKSDKKNIINLNDGSTGNLLKNDKDKTSTTAGSKKPADEKTTGSTENKTISEENTKVPSEESTTALQDMPGDDGENAGNESENENYEAGVVVSPDIFSRDKLLRWPVSGNVLLDFSMDRTIYFPTLDIYKCNSGIMIQSAEDTDVVSAAGGTVKTVAKNEEIGNYIIIDMGDGYEATYGNLKEVCVKEGDKVKMGGKLGKVAAPTKYYSLEGCNVYFELRENGTPIDPLDFLEY